MTLINRSLSCIKNEVENKPVKPVASSNVNTSLFPRDSVLVTCRVRPFSVSESGNPQAYNVVTCMDKSVIVSSASDTKKGCHEGVRKSKEFFVDTVFSPYTTQDEVYRVTCAPIVAGLFEGINGSVLAYGASGSGKTHSVFGDLGAAGLLYRCIKDIIAKKTLLEKDKNKVVNISCNFLEVYNEEIFDLLDTTSKKKKNLSICTANESMGCSHKNSATDNDFCVPTQVDIKGVSTVDVNNVEFFFKIAESAARKRVVAATAANERSSRSHAIVTVKITVKDKLSKSCVGVGILKVCDLAGSERIVGVDGYLGRGHYAEGGSINKSLLALGSVVQALAKRNKEKKNNFIPWRGSKLTRLLQGCIGSNYRTSILFCVAPSSVTIDETLHTLEYAMQAKLIKCSAKRNEYKVDSIRVVQEQERIIASLERSIKSLRNEINILKHPSQSSSLAKQNETSVLQKVYPAQNETSTEKEKTTVKASASETGDGILCSDSVQKTTCDNANYLNDIREKLTNIVNKKIEAHRNVQATTSAISNLELCIRKARYEIASYLATREESSVVCDTPDVFPVGIKELSSSISLWTTRQAELEKKLEELTAEQDAIDSEVRTIRAEVLRDQESQNASMIEVMLDNANLRFTALNAEALATEFSLRNADSALRLSEATEALQKCQAMIRSLLPLVATQKGNGNCQYVDKIASSNKNASNILFQKCNVALAFASVPQTETADILSSFQSSLRADTAKSEMCDEKPKNGFRLVTFSAGVRKPITAQTQQKHETGDVSSVEGRAHSAVLLRPTVIPSPNLKNMLSEQLKRRTIRKKRVDSIRSTDKFSELTENKSESGDRWKFTKIAPECHNGPSNAVTAALHANSVKPKTISIFSNIAEKST